MLLLSAFTPVKISSGDSSHRQINIPRSSIYQHFQLYHVLEHLRHAGSKAVSIYMLSTYLLILEVYFT